MFFKKVLTDPSVLSSNTLQENGITHKQTTFGGDYNTKKFLQEHDPTISKTTLEYIPKDQAELDHQNIVLKSNVDNLALKNHKNGTTPNVDLHTARAEIRVNEARVTK